MKAFSLAVLFVCAMCAACSSGPVEPQFVAKPEAHVFLGLKAEFLLDEAGKLRKELQCLKEAETKPEKQKDLIFLQVATEGCIRGLYWIPNMCNRLDNDAEKEKPCVTAIDKSLNQAKNDLDCIKQTLDEYKKKGAGR